MTEFILEQPGDPGEYRSDTDDRQYMSMFCTDELRRFQDKFKFHKVDFDQGEWAMRGVNQPHCLPL